jgi:hypothetical protein
MTILGNGLLPAFLEHVHAHHQVVVEVLSGVLLVRPDPTHACRQVKHQIGARFAIEPADGIAVDQVEFLAARNDDLGAAFCAERRDEMGAQKTGSARHQHAFAFELHARLRAQRRRYHSHRRATPSRTDVLGA